MSIVKLIRNYVSKLFSLINAYYLIVLKRQEKWYNEVTIM